jgi:hypothetical protein
MEQTQTASQAGQKPAGVLHVFYGHSRARLKGRPRCEGSAAFSQRHVARPVEIARTYFGMLLCAGCWDDWWRAEGSEGMVDPAFGEIKHEHNGEWLA